MCIRDSAESETVWLPVALSPNLVPPWGGTVKGMRIGAAVRYQIDWSEAVSYTHLRAHETVLDLVCRLLLEKKIKQKKKQKQ
mgnify:CR=1 FL=1